MADKDTWDSKTVTIKGHNVVMRRPTDLQLLLLHRAARAGAASMAQAESQGLSFEGVDLDKLTDEERTELARLSRSGLDATGTLLDLLERLLAPEHRQWLVDQMMEGNLDLDDIRPLLQAIGSDDKPTKQPVKKAARGLTPPGR
jgi:hypothetical protein